MIAKQTTTPVTACVIASGPILTALPAHATTRPVTLDGYGTDLRLPAHSREARRLPQRPIRRRAAFSPDRQAAGGRRPTPRARAPIKGWIKVKAADDKHDWASAHYLRKITK
ncbi:hypothetical protein ACFQX6_09800 [Streptosporangium lutulentum]